MINCNIHQKEKFTLICSSKGCSGLGPLCLTCKQTHDPSHELKNLNEYIRDQSVAINLGRIMPSQFQVTQSNNALLTLLDNFSIQVAKRLKQIHSNLQVELDQLSKDGYQAYLLENQRTKIVQELQEGSIESPNQFKESVTKTLAMQNSILAEKRRQEQYQGLNDTLKNKFDQIMKILDTFYQVDRFEFQPSLESPVNHQMPYVTSFSSVSKKTNTTPLKQTTIRKQLFDSSERPDSKDPDQKVSSRDPVAFSSTPSKQIVKPPIDQSRLVTLDQNDTSGKKDEAVYFSLSPPQKQNYVWFDDKKINMSQQNPKNMDDSLILESDLNVVNFDESPKNMYSSNMGQSQKFPTFNGDTGGIYVVREAVQPSQILSGQKAAKHTSEKPIHPLEQGQTIRFEEEDDQQVVKPNANKRLSKIEVSAEQNNQRSILQHQPSKQQTIKQQTLKDSDKKHQPQRNDPQIKGLPPKGQTVLYEDPDENKPRKFGTEPSDTQQQAPHLQNTQVQNYQSRQSVMFENLISPQDNAQIKAPHPQDKTIAAVQSRQTVLYEEIPQFGVPSQSRKSELKQVQSQILPPANEQSQIKHQPHKSEKSLDLMNKRQTVIQEETPKRPKDISTPPKDPQTMGLKQSQYMNDQGNRQSKPDPKEVDSYNPSLQRSASKRSVMTSSNPLMQKTVKRTFYPPDIVPLKYETKISLKAHEKAIRCMVLLRHDLIATAAQEPAIKIWNRDNIELDHQLEGHHSSVITLVYDQQNDILASGSMDKSVRVWSYNKASKVFQEKYVLQKHTDKVRALAIFDEKLVSGGDDCEVNLWSMIDGTLIKNVPLNTGRISALLATGQDIVAGCQKFVVFLDKNDTNKRIPMYAHDNLVVSLLILEPDRINQLYKMNESSKQAGVPQQQTKPKRQRASLLGDPMDDKVLATGGKDQKIKLWNYKLKQLVYTINEDYVPVHIMHIAKHNYLVLGLVGYDREGKIIIWNINDKQHAFIQGEIIESGMGINSLLLYEDKNEVFIYSGSEGKRIEIHKLLV